MIRRIEENGCTKANYFSNSVGKETVVAASSSSGNTTTMRQAKSVWKRRLFKHIWQSFNQILWMRAARADSFQVIARAFCLSVDTRSLFFFLCDLGRILSEFRAKEGQQSFGGIKGGAVRIQMQMQMRMRIGVCMIKIIGMFLEERTFFICEIKRK